jgi:hypothetical protein
MEYIEDIRSLLQGVIFAQSVGSYTLENSAQIAPIVRRILNKYPQLQGQKEQPSPSVPSPPQQQTQPVSNTQQKMTNTQQEQLIQQIKAEPNKVIEKKISSTIEANPVEKREIVMENGIESISLPIE